MKIKKLVSCMLSAAVLASAGIPAGAEGETFHRTRLGNAVLVSEVNADLTQQSLLYAGDKVNSSMIDVYGDGSSGVKIQLDVTRETASAMLDKIIPEIKKALPQGFAFEQNSTYGTGYNNGEIRISHLNYRDAAALYDALRDTYPMTAFRFYPDCGSYNSAGVSFWAQTEEENAKLAELPAWLEANAPEWHMNERNTITSDAPHSALELVRMYQRIRKECGIPLTYMATCLYTFGGEGFEVDFVNLDAQMKAVTEAQITSAYDKYIKDAPLPEGGDACMVTLKISAETMQNMQNDLGVPEDYFRAGGAFPAETYIAEALRLNGSYQLTEYSSAIGGDVPGEPEAGVGYYGILHQNTAESRFLTQREGAQVIAALSENCPYQLDFIVSAAHGLGADPEPVQKGDLNGDGIIDCADAQLVLKTYAEIVAERGKADDEMLAVADVNGDGELSAEDAQLLINQYVRNLASRGGIRYRSAMI